MFPCSSTSTFGKSDLKHFNEKSKGQNEMRRTAHLDSLRDEWRSKHGYKMFLQRVKIQTRLQDVPSHSGDPNPVTIQDVFTEWRSKHGYKMFLQRVKIQTRLQDVPSHSGDSNPVTRCSFTESGDPNTVTRCFHRVEIQTRLQGVFRVAIQTRLQDVFTGSGDPNTVTRYAFTGSGDPNTVTRYVFTGYSRKCVRMK
jgi:hypothetical protein